MTEAQESVCQMGLPQQKQKHPQLAIEINYKFDKCDEQW